jgi:hypothetical protein
LYFGLEKGFVKRSLRSGNDGIGGGIKGTTSILPTWTANRAREQDQRLRMSINTTIRRHEVEAPWEYRELAKVCYEAFDLFNAAFFEGKLPPCLLEFDTANYKKEGRYRRGTNGIGARCEILLNVKHLHRPLYEVLGCWVCAGIGEIRLIN